LITSTQFVGRPGFTPDGDESYDPHTSYGWSKVITEQLTRYSGYTPWTIVRPTTIWGPYSLTHPYRMVGAMRRGLYVHPGRQPCLRSWGYVGNVVHQMMHVLTTSEAQVIGKVFYVGDPPIDLVDFVDAFSRRVTGHPVRVVPRTVVRNLARIGDVVSTLSKKPFLLQSERFHSMTEPYPVPLEPIHELVGKMPFGLQEGIESSLQWLESRRS
jgi:nucleoside-diphosphate-sugar epimerase